VSGGVVAAVLGAALLHASWNALVKGRGGRDPLAAAAGLTLAWVILGAPLAFVVGWPARASWPYLGGSLAVHLVYFSLLVRSYRAGGDLSFVYTIARGLPPVLITAGSLALLGERPGAWAVAGVGLIAAGVLSLGALGKAAPPRQLLVLAVGTALCTAVYTLLDAVGSRHAGAATYSVWLVLLQGAAFALGAVAIGGRPLVADVWAHRGIAMISGLFSAGGYAVALWAMARAPVAPVAALRETSVLFAALIGTLLLGEPFGRRRVLGAALVAAGAVLVRLGT
jgi:drug/metabolite transporter (DMT)-like permease